MTNRAKQFEQKFKEDWNETVPSSFCYRLFDTTSGYYGIRNVSDFICYSYPNIYLIDCKSHGGNTVSFGDFSQYASMVQYMEIKGLVAGTMIWFCDHDKIVWVPVQTWYKIEQEGKKSFNIKMLDDPNYFCIEIESKKLRTFCKANYSKFVEYYSLQTQQSMIQ